MGAPSTDPQLAAQALALGDAGYSSRKIESMIGLPGRTVRDILRGHACWGEIAERPVFAQLRQQQQQYLEAGFRVASAECLARATEQEKLDKASTYQLAIASKIFLESSRLLAGESTQNISVSSRIEVQGLDKFCSILSQALLNSNAGSNNQTSTSPLDITDLQT